MDMTFGLQSVSAFTFLEELCQYVEEALMDGGVAPASILPYVHTSIRHRTLLHSSLQLHLSTAGVSDR